jgi:hypothetical protein
MIVPCRNFLTIWQTFNRHDSTGVDVKKNKKKHLDRKRIQSTVLKNIKKEEINWSLI